MTDIYHELTAEALMPKPCGKAFRSDAGETFNCVVVGQHRKHVSADYHVEKDPEPTPRPVYVPISYGGSQVIARKAARAGLSLGEFLEELGMSHEL